MSHSAILVQVKGTQASVADCLYETAIKKTPMLNKHNWNNSPTELNIY